MTDERNPLLAHTCKLINPTSTQWVAWWVRAWTIVVACRGPLGVRVLLQHAFTPHTYNINGGGGGGGGGNSPLPSQSSLAMDAKQQTHTTLANYQWLFLL